MLRIVSSISIVVFLALTISVAQIRTAIENPIKFFDVIMGLSFEMAIFSLIIFLLLNPTARKNIGSAILFENYNLAGSKGGKSSKRSGKRIKLL